MPKTRINTEKAPAAIGPYSQAIDTGALVFTSGQIPLDPANGQLIADSIEKATIQVLENLQAVLTEAGSSLANVVKTTVFLKDMADFQAVNEVYATYFQDVPPARSCVQAGKLPMDALIEIEAVALKA